LPTTITADDALAEHVLKMLREDYEIQEMERGNAVHVSDLTFPRRTWLGKHNPKPLTDTDLLYFTAGRAHHEILEKMISEDAIRELKVEYQGIVGSVDVLKEDDIPVEVKTTRVIETYSPVNVPSHFVIQLGCYAAMLSDERAGRGELLMFYLGARDRKGGTWRRIPQLRSFVVDYDNLPKIRSTMLSRKALVLGDVIPSTESCSSRLCGVCKWYQDGCDGWGSDLEYRLRTS